MKDECFECGSEIKDGVCEFCEALSRKSPTAGSVHLGILVEAEHEGKTVPGYLTGTGAGKYTGLFIDGKTIAVPKITVKPNREGMS